ncbi:MAG TPA: cytochrome c [Devosia sp.]|nr:cytochrome c [Devosia sp.]
MLRNAVLAAVGVLVIGMSTAAFAQEERSIWSGVFTAEQAERGKAFHIGVCAKCHGDRGDGAGEPDQPQAPAIARASFLRKWDGQSLASLFEYIRGTMPPDNPGSRSDQQYVDTIAWMLSATKAPAGDAELPPDPAILEYIIVGPQPK